MLHVYIAAGLAVVAGIVGWLGRRQANKTDVYGLYVDAGKPSELAAGVPCFYGGQVTAVPGQPQLKAQYSQQPCVWTQFVIEQEERQHDANGAETVSWRQISSSPANSVQFALQSAAGAVYVNPQNADIQKPQQYEQFINPMQGGGVVSNIVNTVETLGGNRCRVRERYIPLGQQLYAGGVPVNQNGQLTLANDASYPLVLTPESKADLLKSGHRASGIEYGIAGVALIAALAVLLFVKK